jgi:hypothetical protein
LRTISNELAGDVHITSMRPPITSCNAGDALQFDATEVQRAAGAIMTLRDGGVVGLQPCDQLLETGRRDRVLADNQVGTVHQQRDRLEILHHIVLQRIDRGIDDELIAGSDADGVTIRGCARDPPQRDAAPRAADVFDHDRLRECAAHGFGQRARNRIEQTARGVGYDDRDRAGRIDLRGRTADRSHDRGQRDADRRTSLQMFRLEH